MKICNCYSAAKTRILELSHKRVRFLADIAFFQSEINGLDTEIAFFQSEISELDTEIARLRKRVNRGKTISSQRRQRKPQR